MFTATEPTGYATIYSSGPIEVAKQVLRQHAQKIGICVTIEPTLFIYTGGEEAGFKVGLINYPKFPSIQAEINAKAFDLARLLLEQLCQNSILVETPEQTHWFNRMPGHLAQSSNKASTPQIEVQAGGVHQIYCLKIAARYADWLQENNVASSFSVFVDDFGYDSSDCRIVFDAVERIHRAAEG